MAKSGWHMYRVFLVYNTSPDEMTIVWRLQTLAAAEGLQLDVPNKTQRTNLLLTQQMITNADAVIVLITQKTTESNLAEAEINYALSLNKTIIPILVKGLVSKPIQTLLRRNGSTVFTFDPAKPWEMESNLFEFLKQKVEDKNTRNAIFALAGTFAGLFLLSKLSDS